MVTSGMVRIVRASATRVTVEVEPTVERTYDRRPDGSWYGWWESCCGNGYGRDLPEPDPDLAGTLTSVSMAPGYWVGKMVAVGW